MREWFLRHYPNNSTVREMIRVYGKRYWFNLLSVLIFAIALAFGLAAVVIGGLNTALAVPITTISLALIGMGIRSEILYSQAAQDTLETRHSLLAQIRARLHALDQAGVTRNSANLPHAAPYLTDAPLLLPLMDTAPERLGHLPEEVRDDVAHADFAARFITTHLSVNANNQPAVAGALTTFAERLERVRNYLTKLP